MAIVGSKNASKNTYTIKVGKALVESVLVFCNGVCDEPGDTLTRFLPLECEEKLMRTHLIFSVVLGNVCCEN